MLLQIVALPSNIEPGHKPVHVAIDSDLPGSELVKLMACAFAVVVPLELRQVSIGQGLILQAMTLGKSVIVTQVNGTEGYIEYMKTCILLPPCDSRAFEEAVRLLLDDEPLRKQLGLAVLERKKVCHLPIHYVQSIAQALGVAGQDLMPVRTAGGL